MLNKSLYHRGVPFTMCIYVVYKKYHRHNSNTLSQDETNEKSRTHFLPEI
jgi:hypothetical protein